MASTPLYMFHIQLMDKTQEPWLVSEPQARWRRSELSVSASPDPSVHIELFPLRSHASLSVLADRVGSRIAVAFALLLVSPVPPENHTAPAPDHISGLQFRHQARERAPSRGKAKRAVTSHVAGVKCPRFAVPGHPLLQRRWSNKWSISRLQACSSRSSSFSQRLSAHCTGQHRSAGASCV